MENQTSSECFHVKDSHQHHYSLEELLLLNPKQCTATRELLRRIPKKIVTCCGLDQCNYHLLLPTTQSKSSADKFAVCDADDKGSANYPAKNLEAHLHERLSSKQEQILPDEIIIAELSDVSESERSAEHFQHCCIHKNNVKISVDDLVRYKTRKTQPPYLAHENAVVNPKRIINREHLESIISSTKSSEQMVSNTSRHKNSLRGANSVNADLVVVQTDSDETPFSRIVKKIKEKGLVPKSVPPAQSIVVQDECPIHQKCSSNSNHHPTLPPNQTALTDNFHSALSMFPSVLRRKIMALSEATSTSSDVTTSVTSITSSVAPEGFQASSTSAASATKPNLPLSNLSAQGKTVVPAGTLERILNSKYNVPPLLAQANAQANQCTSCTCHLKQPARPFPNHYCNDSDEIIDLCQLERLQLNQHRHSNVYANPHRQFAPSVASSTTANKENQQSNEQDNLNFKNLVKQALAKPESVAKNNNDHARSSVGTKDKNATSVQCNNEKQRAQQ